MRKRMRSCHRGLSLVELLVVLAVIGLLCALLLPAIQAARESARATTCHNRQKQLALATESYRGLYGYFPGDTEDAQLTGVPWSVQVLPFLEQNGLWQEFRPEVDLQLSPNLEIGRVRLKVYQCPDALNQMELANDWSPGHFAMNFAVSGQKSVPDGQSQTIGGFEYVAFGEPAGWIHSPLFYPAVEDANACRHRALPVWMTDGSVHRLSKSIDPLVLAALGTRDGGEIVGPW